MLLITKIIRTVLANNSVEAKNFSWLALEKIARLIMSFSVGVWMARYMGPAEFGLFSYITVFVAIFVDMATLSMAPVVTKHFIDREIDISVILGSSALLHFICSLVAILCITISANFVGIADPEVRELILIVSLMHLFNTSNIIRYWFESRLESRLNVLIDILTLIVAALCRVYFIVNDFSYEYFVYLVLFESVFAAFLLTTTFMTRKIPGRGFKVSFSYIKNLCSITWPLAIAGIAISLFMKVDQLMIASMLSATEVGEYAIAVKLTEFWYFIPTSIGLSLYPKLIKARVISPEIYIQKLQKMHDLVACIALIVSVPLALLANDVVSLLYGSQYVNSGPILAIYIWCSVFVFLGTVSGRWYIIENLERKILGRALVGLAFNVGLNLILIPLYGIMGAAVATVISQFMTSFGFDFFSSRTRVIFYIKLRSLNVFRLAAYFLKA